jgi:hypothetical protein
MLILAYHCIYGDNMSNTDRSYISFKSFTLDSNLYIVYIESNNNDKKIIIFPETDINSFILNKESDNLYVWYLQEKNFYN